MHVFAAEAEIGAAFREADDAQRLRVMVEHMDAGTGASAVEPLVRVDPTAVTDGQRTATVSRERPSQNLSYLEKSL